MLYKDSANRKSNQQNLGTIKCSNLCTEIIEYTSAGERREGERHAGGEGGEGWGSATMEGRRAGDCVHAWLARHGGGGGGRKEADRGGGRSGST